MHAQIVGRKREQEKLANILAAKEAQFAVVYGRRRVGKTFLIRNFCANKGIYFELIGLNNGSLRVQLGNFIAAYTRLFDETPQTPKTWLEAFELLTTKIESLPKSETIILFFDELPWLARKKSGFIQRLDYIWNKYWSRIPNLKLITCGSAAAWMLDNLINATGGLYNRVTSILLLKPLTLAETKAYLQHRGIKITHRQILELYMVMGGIPHYLNQIEKSKSSAQNIENICFKEDGILFSEFPRIFESLFTRHAQNRAIVLEISKHSQGISRDLLLKRLKLSSGGSFDKRINELKSSGFIQIFTPYGNKKKEQYYRIIDEYTLFYMRWIDPISNQPDLNFENDYWLSKANSPEWFAWAGYAFENICYKHVPNILRALKIDKISCEVGAWRLVAKSGSKSQGAQIDILIDRADDVIMLGEIKFTKNMFVIDKTYARELQNKIAVFTTAFKTHKQIQLIIIASAGLKSGFYSEELVDGCVTAEDLFV